MENITIDEFVKVEARIGKVLKSEEVEGSDKLIRFELDFGTKTVVKKDEIEKTISGNDKDTFSISSYFWKDGNIIKTASFSKNMILKHEFNFSFDSNKNPYSKIPSYYYTNNMNNTIDVKVNDFTGILDYDYFPPREICYNSDGFLTKYVTSEGEISYLYRNP